MKLWITWTWLRWVLRFLGMDKWFRLSVPWIGNCQCCRVYGRMTISEVWMANGQTARVIGDPIARVVCLCDECGKGHA